MTPYAVSCNITCLALTLLGYLMCRKMNVVVNALTEFVNRGGERICVATMSIPNETCLGLLWQLDSNSIGVALDVPLVVHLAESYKFSSRFLRRLKMHELYAYEFGWALHDVKIKVHLALL